MNPGESRTIPWAWRPDWDSPTARLVSRWLLFGFFLLITFPVPARLMPWPITPELLLYALVALAGVKVVLQQDKRWREDIHVHVVFAVLLVYLALRLGTSIIYFFAEPEWYKKPPLISDWVDCFLVFLLFRCGIRAREDILWILWACTCAVLLWPVLFLLFSVQSNPWMIHIRRSDYLEMLATLLVYFLPLAVALLLLRRAGIAVRLWWVLLAVSSVMLLLSGALGAWLAAVLSTFLSAWYLRRHVSPRTVFCLGGRAFGILVPAVLIVVALWIEGGGSLRRDSLFGVFYDRSAILLEYMLECPLSFLVGHRPQVNCDRVGYLTWRGGGGPLGWFFHSGLIGLSLFGALFWTLLSRARVTLGTLPENLRPLQSAFILGLIGLLIAVSFGSYPRIWLPVWAFAGLMLNLGSQVASDSVNSVPYSKDVLEGRHP